MIIGVPREIKTEEYRVGLTPYNVAEVIRHGHEVVVQTCAGEGIGFFDEYYQKVGARIVSNASEIFSQADMIVKVKEPQPEEYKLLKEGQILFTYLHLAASKSLTQALIDSKCIAVAYETVTSDEGALPLLRPMSQVAGRLAIQAGASCLEKPRGGCGLLLGGVPGVSPGKVVVIGGGIVGTNAVRMAMGKEANVTVLDKSLTRLQYLDFEFGGRLNTIFATNANIEEYVKEADLVIGAVLLPGQAAPKLVTRELISKMRKGSVVVDVAIDQGGCFETSQPTTHAKPTYLVDGIVHYCVTNMPGAVPRTATLALNNATLPFIIEIVNKGYEQAFRDDPHLLNGLNVCKGMVTYKGVARDLGYEYVAPLKAF